MPIKLFLNILEDQIKPKHSFILPLWISIQIRVLKTEILFSKFTFLIPSISPMSLDPSAWHVCPPLPAVVWSYASTFTSSTWICKSAFLKPMPISPYLAGFKDNEILEFLF